MTESLPPTRSVGMSTVSRRLTHRNGLPRKQPGKHGPDRTSRRQQLLKLRLHKTQTRAGIVEGGRQGWIEAGANGIPVNGAFGPMLFEPDRQPRDYPGFFIPSPTGRRPLRKRPTVAQVPAADFVANLRYLSGVEVADGMECELTTTDVVRLGTARRRSAAALRRAKQYVQGKDQAG